MFNPKNIDEVCVQETHLEPGGKNVPQEVAKIHSSMETKERENSKENGQRMTPSRNREKKSHANIVQNKAMMKTIVGNFILR